MFGFFKKRQKGPEPESGPRPVRSGSGGLRQSVMEKLRAAEGRRWNGAPSEFQRQLLEREADYLIGSGAAARIDRQYTVTVRPEWDPRAGCTLRAPGVLSEWEVLELFWQRSGLAQEPEYIYRLGEWKNVTGAWGPDWVHVPCWLCEYESESLRFTLTRMSRSSHGVPVAPLYGCPASRQVRLPERQERPVTVLDMAE